MVRFDRELAGWMLSFVLRKPDRGSRRRPPTSVAGGPPTRYRDVRSIVVAERERPVAAISEEDAAPARTREKGAVAETGRAA